MNHRNNIQWRKSRYSSKAMEIISIAEHMKLRLFSDPDWAKAEAAGIETPVGEVHLHRHNHRGRGEWRIVTPKQNSLVCKTVRCRKVIIQPLGGENEACDLGQQLFEDVMYTWFNNKSLDFWQHYDIKRDTPSRRK